jgi:hypothetical protein
MNQNVDDIVSRMSSRRAQLAEVADDAVSHGANKDDSGERDASRPRDSARSSDPWLGLGKTLFDRWWRNQPMSRKLYRADDMLQQQAEDHPMRLVAIGITAGALIAIIKPWRIIPVKSIATGILVTQATRLASSAIQRMNNQDQNY